MDKSRRNFFRQAISKSSEVVVKKIDNNINKKASNYIRPPYALAEVDFLLTCTRCNACIDACEQRCLFPLSTKLGMDVAATPALNLQSNACLLCPDYPCVAACEPGALSKTIHNSSEEEDAVLRPLKIANITVVTSQCLPYQGPECGVCVDVCPIDLALTLLDNKPVIDQSLCVGCGQCRKICIVEPKAIVIRSIYSA